MALLQLKEVYLLNSVYESTLLLEAGNVDFNASDLVLSKLLNLSKSVFSSVKLRKYLSIYIDYHEVQIKQFFVKAFHEW